MEEATKRLFLTELLGKPVDLVASIWIIDRIPIIFQGDIQRFALWRRDLASGLGVDPSAIIVIGSAAFGISLNPNKNFKYFDDSSDIDVAVVSDYHFNEGWRTLRGLGASKHRLPQKVKQAIDDHIQRYIYWGTIATEQLLPLLPFGSKWLDVIARASHVEPTDNRQINLRIYRDLDSLRAYHVRNLSKLKTEELSKGAS